MFRRHLLRQVLGGVAVLFAVAGAQLVAPAGATAAPAATLARTVYYSNSGEYGSVANQAAQIWNSRVPNVRLVNNAGAATLRIYATTGGGSRAYPQGLGRGLVYIDRNDVARG